MRKSLFGTADTPMILELAPKAHVELLDNRIVVTKDQLVPLVRYNTGDEGGLLKKETLEQLWNVPKDILVNLPETVLFVRGRASDSIIFYGTNLNVQEINRHFLGLPREMAYSGLFTVRKVEQADVSIFEFTILVDNLGDGELARQYQDALICYLKGQSLEFETKYSNLTRSIGENLIRVQVEELTGATGAIKHRYIID
jgi:phenylacetate-CoA ligase